MPVKRGDFVEYCSPIYPHKWLYAYVVTVHSESCVDLKVIAKLGKKYIKWEFAKDVETPQWKLISMAAPDPLTEV